MSKPVPRPHRLRRYTIRGGLVGLLLAALTGCSLVIPESKWWVYQRDYRGNLIACEYQTFLHLDFPLGYGGQGQWIEHRWIGGPSACVGG